MVRRDDLFHDKIAFVLELLSLLRAWKQRVLFGSPGYYLGHEAFYKRYGLPLWGCVMLVPNLLALTFMELLELTSRRFSRPTLNAAAVVLAKLPQKVSWEVLRSMRTAFTLFDSRYCVVRSSGSGVGARKTPSTRRS